MFSSGCKSNDRMIHVVVGTSENSGLWKKKVVFFFSLGGKIALQLLLKASKESGNFFSLFVSFYVEIEKHGRA